MEAAGNILERKKFCIQKNHEKLKDKGKKKEHNYHLYLAIIPIREVYE